MLINGKALLVLFLFLTACTSPAPTNVEGENWIIFSAGNAQADQMLDWLYAGDVAYWSPSEADIHAIEDGLPAYLQENQSAFQNPGAQIWERLDQYKRQYIGVVFEDNKVIYANFFCDETGLDWKKEFVMVLDGGACYFQFKFDSNTGEFFGLQVNGEA